MTYPDAFPTAVVIGVIALLVPALWIAWWLMADLGELVGGRPRVATPRESRIRQLPPAA